MNQPLIHNNLINQEVNYQEPREVARTTETYDKALEQFKEGQAILTVYSILKFIVSMTLIILYNTLNYCKQLPKEGNQNVWGKMYLPIWMYLIGIHSFLAIGYYCAIFKFVLNVDQNIKISQLLGHWMLIVVPMDMEDEGEIQAYIQNEYEEQNMQFIDRMELDGNIEESRRISLLSMDIKRKVQDLSCVGKYIGKGCFILFQLIELWGLIFYFENYSVDVDGCDAMYTKFLLVVINNPNKQQILFLGIYQYLDFYIMFILIVLFLPLLIFYSLYEWLKGQIKKRKEKSRINLILTDRTYTEGLTSGSNECVICMQLYEVGDKIITLPCSAKHHFHSQCIRSWFNVNSLCPLCRNNVIDA